MFSIDHITLEMPDPTAANAFYTDAFGLGSKLRVRASQAPATGFRGYTMSLVVAQPSIVDSYMDTARDGGATVITPAAKSFWGYGGVVQDPFGTIWKIASSQKKNNGPTIRRIDEVVLGLGVADVAVTKQFYLERGLTVAKSFGRKYVEFATAGIKLSLYSRRFAAKTAGVTPEGTGSHRMAVGSDAGTFTDPDGFVWEASRGQHEDSGNLIAKAGNAGNNR